MRLDEIDDADSEKVYVCDFPVTLKSGEKKTLTIGYYALTPERVSKPGIAAQLASMLAYIRDGEEDLQNGDGKKFPINDERHLAAKGLRFLNALSQTIQDDYFPK